jgi:hypothetical protein
MPAPFNRHLSEILPAVEATSGPIIIVFGKTSIGFKLAYTHLSFNLPDRKINLPQSNAKLLFDT